MKKIQEEENFHLVNGDHIKKNLNTFPMGFRIFLQLQGHVQGFSKAFIDSKFYFPLCENMNFQSFRSFLSVFIEF